MPKYEISPTKHYCMPQDIQIINYNDKVIVIAPDYANWIVLDSLSQTEVFKFFQSAHSIQDAIDSSMFDLIDIRKVVTELEARKFCSKTVFSSTDERNLHLYLTNKCNLSCPHCYMFSGKTMGRELTTEELFRVLSDYKNQSIGNLVTISGGEPSCRSDFELIIQKASELGLDVKLLTNGTLFSLERVQRISRWLTSVQISIDGYSEQSNSHIRGEGSFSKALMAVDLFINQGVETSVAITPSIDSIQDHIEDFADFALCLSKKYGDKSLRIKFTDGLIKGRDIEVSDSINTIYSAGIRAIQERLYGPGYEVYSFVEKLRNNVLLDSCMFGDIAVNSTGDVFPCAQIGDLMPFANVRTDSMTDIISKSREATTAAMITKLRPCKDCELRFICGGGCRITEFPELVRRDSFQTIEYDDIPPRICSDSVKNRFYDLMIKSNKYLYCSL